MAGPLLFRITPCQGTYRGTGWGSLEIYGSLPSVEYPCGKFPAYLVGDFEKYYS